MKVNEWKIYHKHIWNHCKKCDYVDKRHLKLMSLKNPSKQDQMRSLRRDKKGTFTMLKMRMDFIVQSSIRGFSLTTVFLCTQSDWNQLFKEYHPICISQKEPPEVPTSRINCNGSMGWLQLSQPRQFNKMHFKL